MKAFRRIGLVTMLTSCLLQSNCRRLLDVMLEPAAYFVSLFGKYAEIRAR
jgi:hypothetical protein